MENKSYKILKDELTKIWSAERAEEFLKTSAQKIDEDQMEALSKMIGYVQEAVENLDEENLSDIMMGMDTFEGPMEFLEYFFKMTQPEVAESVVAALKEDPEEMETMLESMEDSGLIEYIVELNAFYVWYRG